MGSAVLPFWYLLLKGKLAEHCVKVVLRSLQLLGENALSIHHHLNKGMWDVWGVCVCAFYSAHLQAQIMKVKREISLEVHV